MYAGRTGELYYKIYFKSSFTKNHIDRAFVGIFKLLETRAELEESKSKI